MKNPLSRFRSQKADHQPRGPHGEFLSSAPPPLTTLSELSESKGNNPNFLILLWSKLSKLSFKKVATLLGFLTLIATNNITLNLLDKLFPNSSPILQRPTVHQGTLQKSATGQYSLLTPDNSIYTLSLKPGPNLTNLKNFNEVLVKGNLTTTPYIIDNAEIYPLSSDTSSPTSPITQTTLTSQTTSNLPKLYSGLTWDTEEEKVLVFTSGKRRLDMPGVHLESSEVKDFPQGFVDYYIKALTDLGFKQTLNSKTPDGVMQTFAKEDKYFTFGVENQFKGSGDSKVLTGYKAYIEHN